MIDSDNGKGRARIPGSFASGVFAHFEEFQEEQGRPESIITELTLTSGTVVYMKGFWISHLSNVPGVVMVRGSRAESSDALVIREEQIYTVRFDAGPQVQESPFGFAARTTE